MSQPQGESGVWSAAKTKAVTLLAIGQTRLELLGNELEAGRQSAMRQVMHALAMMFCIGLGVVLTIVALTLHFWEQRLVVLGLAGGLVWALALYFYFALRQGAKKTEPLFNASLAELQEDLRQLKAATRHGRAPD
jgi:uncharacterized membrane protein YqjE